MKRKTRRQKLQIGWSNWKKQFFLIVAALVVFTTTYALILPAVTIEEEVAETEPGLVTDERVWGEETEPVEDEGGEGDETVPADKAAPADETSPEDGEEIRGPEAPDEEFVDVSTEVPAAVSMVAFLERSTAYVTASVPEGTILSVTELPVEVVAPAAVVLLGEETTVYSALTIDFTDAEGYIVIPDGPADITLVNDDLALENAGLVQLDDYGNAALVKIDARYDTSVTFRAEAPFRFAVVDAPVCDLPVYNELQQITAEGEDYFITVSYDSNSGLPETGVELIVAEIPAGIDAYEWYVEQAETVLNENTVITKAKLFDISLFVNGEKVEPDGPVNVNIQMKELPVVNGGKLEVVHFTEGGETRVLGEENVRLYMDDDNVNSVDLVTSELSVFGIIGTETISNTVLTADGLTCTVTVTYDEEANIPSHAILRVNEIQEGDPTWFNRTIQLAGVLSEQYGTVIASDTRMLAIDILADGRRVEPDAPVMVNIAFHKVFNNRDVTIDDRTVNFDGARYFAGIHYTSSYTEFIPTDIIEGPYGIEEINVIVSSFSDFDFVNVFEINAPEARQYTPAELVADGFLRENEFQLSGYSDLGKASFADASIMAESGQKGVDLEGRPEHNKILIDNQDGTYTLGLDVQGDADPDVSFEDVNVLIIYDVSSSMGGYYWVPSVTGQHWRDENAANTYTYGRLYRPDGNGSFVEVNDSDNYIGTVYTRSGNGTNQSPYQYTIYDRQRYAHIRRAAPGEQTVYDFVDALFDYQDSDNPDGIQTAVITFNANSSVLQNWTSNEAEILSRFSNDGIHFHGGNNNTEVQEINPNNNTDGTGGYYGSGTNWESAFRRARAYLSNNTDIDNSYQNTDADDTYVIFITDGEPTNRQNNDSAVGFGDGQNRHQEECQTNYEHTIDEATDVRDLVAATGGQIFGVYAYGEEYDYLQPLMYNLRNDNEGYFRADNTEELQNAMNTIFKQIIDLSGIGSASIHDETTHVVPGSASTNVYDLLEVDDTTFQYWMYVGLDNNTFSLPDPTTGESVVYTVSESNGIITITWDGGTAEYEGEIDSESNTVRLLWTEATSFYSMVPPEATYDEDTGDVNWDISSLGTLLDEMFYQVTFECYPSQFTLDLIADLKNGVVLYSDVDPEIQKYLKETPEGSNNYTLHTNKAATLTFFDSRDEEMEEPLEIPYVNPDPVPTAASRSIGISKDWSNILDDRAVPESIQMWITRDGVNRYELILSEDNNWEATKYISFGILTVRNGVVKMKTTGHDYSFSEPSELGVHWELDVPTVRPMLINTIPTTLVKVEPSEELLEAFGSTGTNATLTFEGEIYYKLIVNGTPMYYVVGDAMATLRAVNERRSYLNIVKIVDEVNAPADDYFTYSINVVDAEGKDVWFSAMTLDDIANERETYQLINVSDNVTPEFRDIPADAMYNEEDDTYTYTYNGKVYTLPSAGDGVRVYTGYYSVPSGETFTAEIKADWNLRIINLKTGTTYSVTESAIPSDSYTLESITGNRHYKDSEDQQEKDEVAGTLTSSGGSVSSDILIDGVVYDGISGSIEYANSDYTMTFDNKYSTIDIQLKKVDENGQTISGSVFKLDMNMEMIMEDIKPGDTDTSTPNPVDLGGLGAGRYTLEEVIAPDGYVIVTRHVYFEIYKDNGVLMASLIDVDGNRIESMVGATLTSSGSGENLVYLITVENTPGSPLPHTGGAGTMIYTLSGIVLITAAALMYGFRSRRRERRNN